MLEAMWAANVLDVQHTIRKVRSWLGLVGGTAQLGVFELCYHDAD